MSVFSLGDIVRFRARFTDHADDDPRDPENLRASVVTARGTTTYALIREEVGVFYIDVTVDAIGDLTVRFSSDNGSAEARHRAVPQPIRAPRADDDVVVESVDDDIEVMRDDLAARGVNVAGKSDGVVRAAHAQIFGLSARDQYLARQREAWRRKT